MTEIIEHAKDPIFLSSSGRKLVLRIGKPKRGESRIAVLTTDQARLLAYALLFKAEQQDGYYRQ
jgi:hypothetical protein